MGGVDTTMMRMQFLQAEIPFNLLDTKVSIAMPIFKVNGNVTYFAHIPKCAGTTVEASFQSCGYGMSFHDSDRFVKDPNAWHKSAPQHIAESQLNILFESSFFDYRFTIVRHPVSRFLSAFNYNRYRIGRTKNITRFLGALEKSLGGRDEYLKSTLGHHFFPAVRFLGDDMKVFYLEDGLENIFASLSGDLGVTLTPAGEMNKLDYNKIFLRGGPIVKFLKRQLFAPSPTLRELTAGDLARIENLYAVDFERLGY